MKKERTSSQRSNLARRNPKILSDDSNKGSKETTKEKIVLRIRNKSSHSKFESSVDEIKHKDTFQPKRRSQNASHKLEPSIGQAPRPHIPSIFKHVKKKEQAPPSKPGLQGLSEKTGFSFRKTKEGIHRYPHLDLEKFARTMR